MAEDSRVRVSVRIDRDDYMQLVHWAQSKQMTINEYLLESIKYKIAYDAGDYDVPDAMVMRMKQLIESQANVVSHIENLEDVVVSSMRSLLALTRGDNYLLDYKEDSDHGDRS